eukprot:UN25385
MAVTNSKDDDMTTFRIRKPVSLDRNRAGLVEMFEKDLVSGRKLVVVGMGVSSLCAHSETKLDCMSGIFFTNQTGHGLESGLSCVMNGQTGVYMGEGYLPKLKQNGIAIVTYATEETLRVKAKIEVNGKTTYDGAKIEYLDYNSKPTKKVDTSHHIKITTKSERQTVYTCQNPSKRTFNWVIIYHPCYGELTSPKSGFISFGESEIHEKKRRMFTNLVPLERKKVTVVEHQQQTQTYNILSCSDYQFQLWKEQKLISEDEWKSLREVRDRGTLMRDFNVIAVSPDQFAQKAQLKLV